MTTYMVVERYRQGMAPVYARLAERGRMLPEGLRYVDSWVVPDGQEMCFQLMEAERRELFDPWVAAWADLVDFEIHPVVSSAAAAAAARPDRS